MASLNVSQNRVDSELLVVSCGFVITGSFNALSNVIIITTILANKALRRKELLLIAASCTAESLYGIGFVIGGSRRVYLVSNFLEKIKVSPWSCQLEPATFFYIYGPQAGALMHLFISLDRFLAVAFFPFYRDLTGRYLKLIFITAFGIPLISYLVGFAVAYFMYQEATVAALCLSTWASSPKYAEYYTGFIAACEVLASIVYIGVFITVRNVSSRFASIQDEQRKYQIKVAKAVGLVVACTVLFYVVPWCCQVLMTALKIDLSQVSLLSPILWLIIQTNIGLNSVIYIYKLKEVKNVLLKMLRRCSGKSSAVEPLRSMSQHGAKSSKF